MAGKRKTEAKPLSGRARKEALMVRAREVAAKGMCIGFSAVLMQFDEDNRTVLKLYATAADRDEIDRICDRTRIKKR